MKLIVAGLLLAVGALCTPPAASVSGFVFDPSGASVVGASVALTDPDGSPLGHTVTGPDGAFRFGGVFAGVCRITVRRDGFEPEARDVEIRGGAASVRITLRVAVMRQQVTVTAEAGQVAVDPAENLDRVALDRDLLDDLPILDQDVLGAVSQFLDQSLVSSAGYSLVVDGVETADVGVSASAVEEVGVNRNPYSAEFQSPGKGRIEITTKGSGPVFHGSLNLLARDYRLDARNAFAASRPPENRRIVEGHLTGPLSRAGRTFFLLSANYEQDNEWAVVFAETPRGLLRSQAAQPDRERELSWRITRRVSDTHSLSARYEYEGGSSRGRGVGGFALPEAAYDETDREHDFQFSHQFLVRGAVLSQFRLRLQTDDDRTVSALAGVPRIVVLGAFTSGGAQAEARRRKHGLEFAEVFSWNLGRHHFRSGVLVHDLSRRSYLDGRDRDGAFFFSSIEDYLDGRPFSFTRQTGAGRAGFWNADATAFVQSDFRLRRNLSVGMGLRYEYHMYPPGTRELAPRFSLAYAPGKDGRTVIRGGAGVFFDQLSPEAVRDVLLLDGERLSQILIVRPGYPDPSQGGEEVQAVLSNVVRFHPRLKTPRLIHVSAGLERRLWGKSALAITYGGVRGDHLFRSRDLNAPLPADFQRPDPRVAILRQIESTARLEGHGLDLAFRGSLTRFFQGGFLYTLGRARNDTDGIDSLPADSLDLSREWARAAPDRRHRFRTYGTMRFAKLFQAGLVLSVHSGRPYNLTTGRDDNRDGRAQDRPSGVPRNSLSGPGGATLDLRWSKEFRLAARKGAESPPSLRLALDAFNALNRVNYSRLVGNLSSPFFGQPIAAQPARKVQLSLQLKF